MSRKRIVCFAVALSAALLGAAAPAQAQVIVGPVISLAKPTDIAYDPWEPDVYVSNVGPPPRIYVFDEDSGGLLDFFDLPSDADPGAIAFDPDGYLWVVDNTHNRTFIIDVETGQIVDTLAIPSTLNFAIGLT